MNKSLVILGSASFVFLCSTAMATNAPVFTFPELTKKMLQEAHQKANAQAATTSSAPTAQNTAGQPGTQPGSQGQPITITLPSKTTDADGKAQETKILIYSPGNKPQQQTSTGATPPPRPSDSTQTDPSLIVKDSVNVPNSELSPKPGTTPALPPTATGQAQPIPTKPATVAEPQKPVPLAEKYLSTFKPAEDKNSKYKYNLDSAFDKVVSEYRTMTPVERRQFMKTAKENAHAASTSGLTADDEKENRRRIGLVTQYEALKALDRGGDIDRQANLPMGKIRNNYDRSVKQNIDKMYRDH